MTTRTIYWFTFHAHSVQASTFFLLLLREWISLYAALVDNFFNFFSILLLSKSGRREKGMEREFYHIK